MEYRWRHVLIEKIPSRLGLMSTVCSKCKRSTGAEVDLAKTSSRRAASDRLLKDFYDSAKILDCCRL